MSKLRNTIAIILILLVMAVALPLSVPRLLGYQIYHVVTASMSPAYPVDSVIFVRPVSPVEIQVGDAITYRLERGTSLVETHRVIEVDEPSRQFITKGDANESTDPYPVLFENVVGKVIFSIPYFGWIFVFLGMVMGRAILIGILAIALALLAGQKRVKGRVLGQMAGLALILGAAAYLGITFSNYHQSGEEYQQIREHIFGESDGTTSLTQLQENLANLRQQNPDVVAWIAFDNLDISYPVMHGYDNLFYLNHTFSGTQNPAGSIFLDAGNASSFQDAHTIVYGHNMRNGSMFGQLRNFRDSRFAEENRYFTVYTLDREIRYEIFSFYEITEFGDVYTLGFGHDEIFGAFVDNMLRRSRHDFQVAVSQEDRILTLSTCSAVGMRFVVHGREIALPHG